MDDKTCKEYRNRICHIYSWWMIHYPTYLENGTRVLTEEDKSDQVKIHHTNDRDIIYSGYTLGMWSFKIKLSDVKNHGTAADKARLPAETSANQQHKSKCTINP